MNLGWSTCPMCQRRWLVTMYEDCMMPACGCYGHDTSEKNPNRPCESCGINHALNCSKLGLNLSDEDKERMKNPIVVTEDQVVKPEDDELN